MKAVGVVHWLTAGALLATLYGHTLLGMDRADVTPLAAAAVMASLVIGALFSLRLPAFGSPSTLLRQVAGVLLLLAWLTWLLLTLIHYADRRPDGRDLGLLAVVCGLPVLLLLQVRRGALLERIAFLCVFAALADAAWNVASLMDLVSPLARAGRITEFGRLTRYPGLTGNTLGSGLVALIASCSLASRIAKDRRPWVRAACAASLIIILGDLYLIDARRDLGEALLGCGILLLPLARRVNLILVSAITAAGGLWLVFSSADPENIQRGTLMTWAWEDARGALWAGSGLFFRAAAPGPDFNSLWAAGVTESGIIDLVIAFGLPATMLFLAGAFAALGASRKNVTYPAVLTALMIGELAYGGGLGGILGTAVLYASLAYIVLEEAPIGGQFVLVRETVLATPTEPPPRAA
jgi:hypothetical protein